MPQPNTALIVTSQRGIEDLLAREVAVLGLRAVRPAAGEVVGQGDAEVAAEICLWSRLASRVLRPLGRVAATDGDALYATCAALPWPDILPPGGTLAVDVSHGAGRPRLAHRLFAAQRVKDAVVDVVSRATGDRPAVDRRGPTLRLHLRLYGDAGVLAVDVAGRALHRRGYRDPRARAPLRETLAAAVLQRCGYAGQTALVDPMCGSGTLLIEAAMLAADVAPGLAAGAEAPPPWGTTLATWQARLRAARARAAAAPKPPPIVGSDHDPAVLAVARAQCEAAGVAAHVRLHEADFGAAAPPPGAGAGHVVINPPYGERLGEAAALTADYARLGAALRARFAGWQAHVLTASEPLARATGLRAHRRHTLLHGPLTCMLLHVRLDAVAPAASAPVPSAPPVAGRAATQHAPRSVSEAHHPLVDRIRKNLRRLARWRRAEGVSCFRAYDADIPEYAVAIDVYGDRAYVQEYRAPSSIPAATAAARLAEAVACLPMALGVSADRIVVGERRRQGALGQYEAAGGGAGRFVVEENGARYLVDLGRYLDTGLFLDHRPLRAELRRQAAGRAFLNLFGYTGSATVAAALGGAAHSVTVDLSTTYLDWAADNFDQNGLDPRRHALTRADCMAYLEAPGPAFDLIMLDPPTFSHSKRMRRELDVQRDHPWLIDRCLARLTPGGTLYFSTHARRFTLGALPAGTRCEDWTAPSLPPDFARDPRHHRCWRLTRAAIS